MLVPEKRFASRVDPLTRNLAFHRFTVGPGSMLYYKMVHWGRISFHEQQNLTHDAWYGRIVNLVPPGRGCRIAATWADFLEASVLQFHKFDEPYLERLCSGDFRTESHFVAYFSELIQLKLRSRVNSLKRLKTCGKKLLPEVLRCPARSGEIEAAGAVRSLCEFRLQ